MFVSFRMRMLLSLVSDIWSRSSFRVTAHVSRYADVGKTIDCILRIHPFTDCSQTQLLLQMLASSTRYDPGPVIPMK